MSAPEAQLREAVDSGEALQGHLQRLEEQLGYLGALSQEFGRSRLALEALKDAKPGEEVLLSLGGGNFVRAKVADPSKVISGLGAGYSVEGSVQDALRRCDEQLEAAREASQKLQEEAQRTLQQMQALEERIAQLQG